MKITLTIPDRDLRLVLRGLLEMENEIRNEWRKRTDRGACYKSEIAHWHEVITNGEIR